MMKTCVLLCVACLAAVQVSSRALSPGLLGVLLRQPPAPEESTLEIKKLHIRSDIAFRFATTHVTSQLTNNGENATEAAFRVTLPKTAFMTNFSMVIDEQTIYGEVKEKAQAQKQYNESVSRGQSAGHVAATTRDSNKFVVSVNVAGGKEVVFNLIYQEVLQRRRGHYNHVINIEPGRVVPNLLVEVSIIESRPLTNLAVPPLEKDIENAIIGGQHIPAIGPLPAHFGRPPNVRRGPPGGSDLGARGPPGLPGSPNPTPAPVVGSPSLSVKIRSGVVCLAWPQMALSAHTLIKAQGIEIKVTHGPEGKTQSVSVTTASGTAIISPSSLLLGSQLRLWGQNYTAPNISLSGNKIDLQPLPRVKVTVHRTSSSELFLEIHDMSGASGRVVGMLRNARSWQLQRTGTLRMPSRGRPIALQTRALSAAGLPACRAALVDVFVVSRYSRRA